MRANQSERVPVLASMLRHVRLPLLEPAYFVETVETDELIRRCVDAFPVIQEARCYHLLGSVVGTASTSSCANSYPTFTFRAANRLFYPKHLTIRNTCQ